VITSGISTEFQFSNGLFELMVVAVHIGQKEFEEHAFL
jgi:hypothetical protein